MSTHTAAFETIKQAWLTAWNAGPLVATLPIEHENHPFKQPTEGPWGRLSLQTGKTEPAAIGRDQARLDRTPFALSLQVFMPEHSGTKKAYQAADAMGALNGMSIAGAGLTVNFRTAGIEPAPEPGNSGTIAYLVQIPGQYDLSTPPPP